MYRPTPPAPADNTATAVVPQIDTTSRSRTANRRHTDRVNRLRYSRELAMTITAWVGTGIILAAAAVSTIAGIYLLTSR